MPVKANGFIYSLFATALLIAFTGYSHQKKTNAPPVPLREQIAHTKKLQPPIQVSLDLVEDEEVRSSQTYTLKATLKSKQSFANVRWEWQGAENLTLLDAPSGVLNEVRDEQERNLSMRFMQSDSENKRIKLILRDGTRGHILGRAYFNTTRQRHIARENKELLERQEEYLKENMHLLERNQKPKHTH